MDARSSSNAAIGCPEITGYLDLVETGAVRSCERQRKFARYIRRTFAEEDLTIDRERLERYKGYTRYFPFERLFPWEWCLLALFLCTFKADGEPRWDELICFIGRGSGKNGFIAFIAFCVITVANGIGRYHVDIVANSEDQAKTSFDDVYDVLDGDPGRFSPSFRWTKTEIENKTTRSKLRFRTSGTKSKDGGRPGFVVFDEVHEYTRWKMIEVMTTGLGKVDHGRVAYISSNGDVRDGVYDSMLADCDAILNGEEDDDGRLPFVCSLDEREQVFDERNWEMAVPSLPYLPERMVRKMRKEYRKWRKNPGGGNASFMTRRMGIPQGDIEHEVATWDDLKRASREVPDLTGLPCVLGIDFARQDDFVSCVLLFREGGEYYAVCKSWLCANSRDRGRLKIPVEEWDAAGYLEIVDAPEISASAISDWIYGMQGLYDIRAVGMDSYRYDILAKELRSLGFDADKKGYGNILRVRPSNHMMVQPIINSAFINGRIAWGENPLMRWFANNTKLAPFANGNYKYEKIEPRGRKTDGFMALVAAFCVADAIPEYDDAEVLAPITL